VGKWLDKTESAVIADFHLVVVVGLCRLAKRQLMATTTMVTIFIFGIG
jgi:hypothetical protein